MSMPLICAYCNDRGWHYLMIVAYTHRLYEYTSGLQLGHHGVSESVEMKRANRKPLFEFGDDARKKQDLDHQSLLSDW